MKDIKRERIFEEPTDNQNEAIGDPFKATSSKEFDLAATFVEQDSLASEAALSDVASVIRPSRTRKWGVSLLAVGFTGLLAWQLTDLVLDAINTKSWLSLGWTGFIAGLSVFGIARLLKEVIALRKLRHHFTLQEQAEALIEQNSVGHAQEFCEKLATNGKDAVDKVKLAEWKNKLHGAHSDAEVFDLYDSIVMKQQDELALETISKYSSESAALVAISPLAIADMLLVAWRNLKMVDDLSEIYGVSLGYWARIRLFKSVLKNMAFAGVTELAIDSGMDMLSTSLASKLSARAGQGIGVGILNARLGVQALTLLRPLPWFPDRNVKLGHVRKQIIGRVKSLVTDTTSNKK
ncbi:YcjF family protein [Vibrio sp. RC27]